MPHTLSTVNASDETHLGLSYSNRLRQQVPCRVDVGKTDPKAADMHKYALEQLCLSMSMASFGDRHEKSAAGLISRMR